MIELLLFVIVMLLLMWVYGLSGRISKLEKQQSLHSSYSANPSPAHLQNVTEIVDDTKAGVEPLPSNRVFSSTRTEFSSLQAEPEIFSHAEQRVDNQSADGGVSEATNWLNRIGVVALVLGMGLFFKYAIDQGWINPWMRIGIGFLVGGLLVYLGQLWKEKYGERAQGLAGGGIAILYFSIFAAYQIYHLINQPVAFILVLLIAAGSIWLSYLNSFMSLGVLGFFGAYGAPLMIHANVDQHVALFIYLSLLNASIIVILTRKLWTELSFLALIGTSIDFVIWAARYGTHDNAIPSLFFVIVTIILQVAGLAILVRYHHTKKALPLEFEKSGSLTMFFAGLFYITAINLLLTGDLYGMLAPVALLGSIIFFFSYALIDRLNFKNINYVMSFFGALLLALSAYWQWDGKALAFAWLGIALLGVTIGVLVKREELRLWGICLLLISLFKAFIEPYSQLDHVFLFNAKFGLLLAETMGILYAGWLYEKVEATEFERSGQDGFFAIAALVLFAGVSWDISAAILGHPSLWYNEWTSLWWVIFPTVLAYIATVSKRKILFNLSLLLIVLALLRVLVLPYEFNHALLWNAKFGLMLGETLALIFLGVLYKKNEDHQNNQVVPLLQGASAVLFWIAVSWEITEYFKGYDQSNIRNLLLSFWWVTYAAILFIVANMRRSVSLRKLAIVVFAFAILKVFLYDVQALDTAYRIIAFIVLGVILLSVSFTYQRNKEKIEKFWEGQKEGVV